MSTVKLNKKMWTFALGLTLGLAKDILVAAWPCDWTVLLAMSGVVVSNAIKFLKSKCSSRKPLQVPCLDIHALQQKQAQMNALDEKLAKISEVNLRSLEKFLQTMAQQGCDAAEVAAAESALAGAYFDGSFRRIDDDVDVDEAQPAEQPAAVAEQQPPELVPLVETCRTATEIAAAGALLDLKN